MAKTQPNVASKPAAAAVTSPAASPAPPAAPAATAAPTAAPANGAAPADGEKKKRTGGKPKPRVVYPGLYKPSDVAGADPVRVKLKEIPADYSPKKHKPMTRKDFEDESLFFELQAQVCERKAKRFREMAEESKKLGNVGDVKTAKKLLGMQKRMNEMVAALKKENPELNIEDMLAKLTTQLEGDNAAETTPAETK